MTLFLFCLFCFFCYSTFMISVIIPVYNNYKELSKCLKSLEEQTFSDFEVILVDDGSDKKEILSKSNLDIQFFKIEHGGAPNARNYGFKKSKGEFVLFCDSDMELKSNCLEKMYNALNSSPDKSYVYSDFKYGLKPFKFFEFDASKLKENNFVNTCSLLRRDDFLGFDETLERFQDWDLWLSLSEIDKTGVYIPEILFKANTSSGRISNWLPSFLYNFSFLSRVKKYREAKAIVQKKHGISI
jgi:glycosyltransferase involved in cell wall biosynthesis